MCTAVLAGGALVWANNIPLTKAQYTLTVGAGGVGANKAGGDSWFNTASYLVARGGKGGSNTAGGAGGRPAAAAALPWWGGGWGGRGGDISWSMANGMIAGGGGGAGGYNGGWLPGISDCVCELSYHCLMSQLPKQQSSCSQMLST
jgi:hypothetical protein